MGEREVLIVSGEGHMVGEGERSSEAWEVLERWAQEELGAGDALFRWSTQDYYPLDRVPFVGALEKHVYTATGFGGWGMTGGTAAAQLWKSFMTSAISVDGRRGPDLPFRPRQALPDSPDSQSPLPTEWSEPGRALREIGALLDELFSE